MAKRIMSIVVMLSFLVNSVCVADVFSAKCPSKVSSETLSPESRLSPVTDNTVMLDVMKLTAAAMQQQSKEDIGIRGKAVPTQLPPAQISATPSTGTKEWFPDIKAFKYEGPDAKNRRAFQWYDPNGTIDGRPMKDVFRFSMAWWHAMRGEGSDIFGGPSKTLPWLQNPDPMQRARDTVDAGFELMSKLGIPFYAFHDRDVAPEATKADGSIDVVQSEKNLREIAAYLKQKQDETGIKLLWGTANLFSNRRFMNGAATNPDLNVLLHSAAQVKAVLEVTNELGGANYVLWGGREGYYSLINTCTDKELDNLAQFLRMVRDHAKKIGFKGKLMIEPKAKEPTAHQYDYDAATVMGFLRKYGLEKDFFLNIEPNHAALAGHTGQHDLQVAADNGTFNGLDANSGVMPGAPQLGWDTDHFPGLADALEAMLVIDKIGGFKSGGVHFDAKTHRTSTDREDIFIAHALGMDSYVLAHIIAKSYLADSEVQEFLRDRYASYDTELGKRFKDGKLTLEDAAKLAAEIGEPVQKSGKLEFLQRKLQQHMIMAPVNYFISQRNARAEYTHEAIDKVTPETAPAELTRPGDEIVFDYRHKVVVGDTEFIPCWIKGIKHGDKVITTRQYLCRASKVEGNKYDYEFIPTKSKDLKGKDIKDAVKDQALLASLAKQSRPADVKAGVARYAAQQDVDRYIADVITGKVEGVTAARMTINDTSVSEVYDFLTSNEFKVSKSFFRLVEFGQVMMIPGLKAPHAGGMGIYLTDTNYATLIHEIFAKCGLDDDRAEQMIAVYNKLKNREQLEDDESALLEKAKTLDFVNRWDDMLNIDYNRLTIDEMPQVLIDKYHKVSGKNWYLGIDSSTQSVKFDVKDAETGETIWQWQETFSDEYYKDYGAPTGWLLEPLKENPDAAYYTDPRMMAEALDRGMAAVAKCFGDYGWDINNVRAISGAGQQHGLVFLNTQARQILANLDTTVSIKEQIGRLLAWNKATIWKNKMTDAQQKKVNDLFGGPEAARKITGSSAELRFGLLQALWLLENHPEIYNSKEMDTIVNIAGFNLALLTGIPAFDPCDGAGTNAMDIRTDQWLPQIDTLVPGLSSKLAPIRPTNDMIGKLSSYWVSKYGFSPETKVYNFTGDNPSAARGQGMIKPGRVSLSLGTSNVGYAYVDEDGLEAAQGSDIGNVFKTEDGKWMKLVCFQNGADTLKRVRDDKISNEEAIARLAEAGNTSDKYATTDEWNRAIDGMKWVIFGELVSSTSPGNDGAMMITQVEDETVMPIRYIAGMPWTRNLDYYNDDRGKVLRAAAEGQIRFLEYVMRKANLRFTEISLTGGAARNPVIRQMVADIFKVNVNVLKRGEYFPTEAVAAGGAINAAQNDLRDRKMVMSQEDTAARFAKADYGIATPKDADKYSDEQKRIFEQLVDAAIRQSADKETVERLAGEGRIAAAIDFHKKSFGEKPQALAEGPGRVNLFGEHSDYAGGQVMPIALDGVSVITAVSSRTDGKIVIASPRFGKYETTVEALRKIAADAKAGLAAIPEEVGWARYPLGVIRQLMDVPGVSITGLNISYDGNVPLGGGLSSSAAVETSVFTASDVILKTGLDIKGAARLCQKAEHWRGNMCGIMDQYASLAGKKGNAILLNCNTLESQPVDISFLDIAGYAIVAVDTGLPKTDEAWRKYMARRGALETAVEQFFKLRPELGVNTILDIAPKVTPEVFNRITADLLAATNEEVVKRMSHVVAEEARVLRAAKVAAEANVVAARLRAGDESARPELIAKVREFAAILNEVHESLDKVYEMSSPYLNKLVESAMQYGSAGSRLTGAGVVGATVNIVSKNHIESFSKGVVADYRAAFPDQPVPVVTVSRAGDGARALDTKGTREGYGIEPTGVVFNRNEALRLRNILPQGVAFDTPQIESATVAPDYGMNLVSWQVRLPGQTEPTEVLVTSPLEQLRDTYIEGPNNPYGKAAFAGQAGPLIGVAPNRFVGPEENGKVLVTFPNGDTTWVPANHTGTKVPLLHLHGFFHRLVQKVSSLIKADQNATVEGSVDVKAKSEQWPWPSDSNIVSRRTIADNKLKTTVVQKNTGTAATWASWVEHSYFKNLPGVARGDVRLKLPATAMTPVSLGPDGKPDYVNCLPTGEVRDLKGTQYGRFMAPEGGELKDTFFDDSFTNLVPQADGSIVVEVIYPKAGVKLMIKAYDKVTRADGKIETGNLRSIQVYSPTDKDFVCVEIGAHLNNPFDKKTWGDRDTGMVKLNPGDTYEYNLEYEYLPIVAGTSAAAEEPFPAGIDETVIDIAASESAANKTVVFVSQDFAASAERCRELLPAFTNVEYIPFNQHTQLNELPALVSQAQYDGYRKVLITSGLAADQIRGVVSADERAFAGVIPVNTGAESFTNVAEQRSFQKGVLTIALLGASVPKDQATYKQSRSYMVLKSLLTRIFESEKDADEYITNLVNPDGTLTVSTRFGFLIGKIIGPVKRLVVNGFTRIVNIFA